MSAALNVPRFFVSETFGTSGTVTVGEDAAAHMRVLRLGPGSPVTLLDGLGGCATGTVRTLAKRNATVTIDQLDTTLAPPALHALVPIADRDRMLWLAEKAAELGVTSWRPVLWKRSRSVSPRGEGSGFQRKVGARMASALEQSGNAWLPVTYPDSTLDRVLASLPDGPRFVLDRGGGSMAHAIIGVAEPVTIAVGPEGGLEESELLLLQGAGFRAVSLGQATLRFETAGIVALAYARTALANLSTPE